MEHNVNYISHATGGNLDAKTKKLKRNALEKRRRIMNQPSDPYEAARRAYFIINPEHTDEDWKSWIDANTTDLGRGFDKFHDLSLICQCALALDMDIASDLREFLAFADGYFQGAERIVRPAWVAQPVSPHVPNHFPRYRLQQLDERSQFEGVH